MKIQSVRRKLSVAKEILRQIGGKELGLVIGGLEAERKAGATKLCE
jgi:hypothetical protein